MQKSDLIRKVLLRAIVLLVMAVISFVYIKRQYTNTDFGNTFGTKAKAAEDKLLLLKDRLALCAATCNSSVSFMQAIVFPEVMRYNTLKDDIESESLKVLYVQFGKDYADFSVGTFQMKPSFAEQVERKAKALLPDSTYTALQLAYDTGDEEAIRRSRLRRLLDEDWQLVYLTAFNCICDVLYHNKNFAGNAEKLQWYATIYNAGFDRPDEFVQKKIAEDNFYLGQQMPGKKFKYAAIAAWYYQKCNTISSLVPR